MSRAFCRSLSGLFLAVALTGCGATAYNVRAYRAYAYEEPKLLVAIDRVEDLARTLELIDRFLLLTPYTPGDRWVKKLPITDSDVARIRNDLKTKAPYSGCSNCEIPLVKIYRVHLEEVMANAPPPRSRETDKAEPGDDTGEKGTHKKKSSDADSTETSASDKPKSADEKKDSTEPEKSASSTDPDAGAEPTAKEPSNEEKKPADAGTTSQAFPSILAALSSLSGKDGAVDKAFDEYTGLQKQLIEAKAEADKANDAVPNIYQGGSSPSESQRAVYSEAKKKADVADAKVKTIRAKGAAIKTSIPETLRKSVEGQAGGADRATILSDATAALSVALRLELESLALLPIIAIQTSRSVLTAGSEARNVTIKGITQVKDLPDNVSAIEEKLTWQIGVVEAMTEALAKAGGKEVQQTPGFAMRESLVDQVVGIGRDSFRFNVKAGAEAFFFTHDVEKKSNQTQSSSSSDDVKITKDYTGRTQRLQYNVKPIYLANVSMNVGFDWINLPNAGNLNLGYTTDRAFSSGGTIDNSGSLGQQLGVKGVASDALDVGLGILGVQTSVRVAKFTTGYVRLMSLDSTNDQDLGYTEEVPLQLKYTQVDVGYDTAFLFPRTAGKIYMEQLIVGFRYFDYTLPRILYELEDTNSDPKTQDFKFVRESPPQNVRSKYYMGGFKLRMGPGEAPVVSWFTDLALYLGGGPAAYYFLIDPNLGDVDESNRDRFQKSAFALNGMFAGGLRVRLYSAGKSARFFAELLYRADLISSSIQSERADVVGASSSSSGTEQGRNRIVEFGGTDIFHGPQFRASATF